MEQDPNQENININLPRKWFILLTASIALIALVLLIAVGFYAYNTPTVQKTLADRAKANEIQQEKRDVAKANAFLALERTAEKKATEAGAEWGKEDLGRLGLDYTITSVNLAPINVFLYQINIDGAEKKLKPNTVKNAVAFLNTNYQHWWVFRVQYREKNVKNPYYMALIVKDDGEIRELSVDEFVEGFKSGGYSSR